MRKQTITQEVAKAVGNDNRTEVHRVSLMVNKDTRESITNLDASHVQQTATKCFIHMLLKKTFHHIVNVQTCDRDTTIMKVTNACYTMFKNMWNDVFT